MAGAGEEATDHHLPCPMRPRTECGGMGRAGEGNADETTDGGTCGTMRQYEM
jgi:hypothetical protein